MKIMKTKLAWFVFGVFALVCITSGAAMAGAPLTNAEGVGGGALNPFAYVTNPLKEGDKGLFREWNYLKAADRDMEYWTHRESYKLVDCRHQRDLS